MYTGVFTCILYNIRICSPTSEFNKNCDTIAKRFRESGYPNKLINEHTDKVKNMKRKQLLSTNKRIIQNRMQMLMIYNRSWLNISNIITKKIGAFYIYQLLFKGYFTSQ